MTPLLRLILLAVLALSVGACDSETDPGLVLHGTYSGQGQAEVSAGADPGTIQFSLDLTFDQASPGSPPATLRAVVSAFGSPPVTYTGTARVTLSASGALSFDTDVTSATNQSLALSASGTATAGQITVDLGGDLPASDVVLRR